MRIEDDIKIKELKNINKIKYLRTNIIINQILTMYQSTYDILEKKNYIVC